ncbi:MAG: leucine-rich repeat domain-containing protein [Paludibacteraceae bacterium]|nr:leucine-rich repeat domain-containing protein [Paludibacteraceae bacterium]
MKKLILIIFSLCVAVMSQALTVASTAGGLSTAITAAGGTLSTVTNLTVTGTIDERDFATIHNSMSFLSVVNLSGVTIAAYTIYPANAIPDYAFEYCSSLTLVTIPSSVTSIGRNAFYECYSLTSITIPTTVTSIGTYAFYDCTSLKSVAIPSSVTSIGEGTFQDCVGLTTISFAIPSSVTSIGVEAFQACTGLTSITIPSSVTSIGAEAFYNCSGLITVDVNNPNYSSIDGVLFNKAQTTLIQCPTSKTGSYAIPSSVTSIGEAALGYCTGLTSVSIPSSVTSIGTWAFSCCSGLTTISFAIPSSVTSIGSNAFYECYSLTSITIPTSVTSIGSSAFYECTSLTSVAIPSSITSIEGQTFYYCVGLTSITIPSSVTSIGGSALYECTGLKSITIPSSVTSIGDDAFDWCTGLTSIYADPTTPVALGSSTVFYNVDTTTCTLYVPTGSVSLYQTANQWKAFYNRTVGLAAGISTNTIEAITIYPNPVTDGFNISGLNGVSCVITIIDASGKTVLTKEITGNQYVAISELPQGLYIVKIKTDNGTIEKKIIKK